MLSLPLVVQKRKAFPYQHVQTDGSAIITPHKQSLLL